MRKSGVIEQINLVFTYITNNIDNSEATLIQHHVGIAKQSSQVVAEECTQGPRCPMLL